MKTNEQIRALLTGDDGKARKRCETCGGDGKVDVCHKGESWDEPCPDCDGGWVVNERRLLDSLYRGIGFGSFTTWCLGPNGDKWDTTEAQKACGNDTGTIRLWLWNNRNNEPWQAALEAHVDSYVEPAPDYKTTPEALKAALRAGNWNYGLWYSAYLDRNRFNAHIDREGGVSVHYGTGETEAEAFLDAVQAALTD